MGTDEPGDILDTLALTLIPGVGPRLQAVLLEQFGSATAVLNQSRDALAAVPGIGEHVTDSLLRTDYRIAARDVLTECQQHDITLVTRTDATFPRQLAEICDPPALLYVRGELLPRDDLTIAIVGSRRCTAYGRKHAYKLAGGLARAGFTIVSGLARGIDAAAHQGAMDAGGRTIAVLATGVRDIYPPEHAELASRIAEQGALVSEFPLNQAARRGVFPQRNRIISGLSLAVLVVEAARTSGALHTVRHAQEQGREVYALPGQVDSLSSAGCLDLIRDGVTLVRNADDIINDLGPLPAPVAAEPDVTIHNPRELTLNGLETEVLNLISVNATHVDEILRATQLPAPRVLSTLTVLEMKRFIRRLPGSQFIRPE
jgi:DNA processing protein